MKSNLLKYFLLLLCTIPFYVTACPNIRFAIYVTGSSNNTVTFEVHDNASNVVVGTTSPAVGTGNNVTCHLYNGASSVSSGCIYLSPGVWYTIKCVQSGASFCVYFTDTQSAGGIDYDLVSSSFVNFYNTQGTKSLAKCNCGTSYYNGYNATQLASCICLWDIELPMDVTNIFDDIYGLAPSGYNGDILIQSASSFVTNSTIYHDYGSVTYEAEDYLQLKPEGYLNYLGNGTAYNTGATLQYPSFFFKLAIEPCGTNAQPRLSAHADTEIESNLRIAPNPATDHLKIELLSNSNYSTISIMNLNGQVVMSKAIDSKEFELDINTLPSGMYLLKAEGEDKPMIEKFIKE